METELLEKKTKTMMLLSEEVDQQQQQLLLFQTSLVDSLLSTSVTAMIQIQLHRRLLNNPIHSNLSNVMLKPQTEPMTALSVVSCRLSEKGVEKEVP